MSESLEKELKYDLYKESLLIFIVIIIGIYIVIGILKTVLTQQINEYLNTTNSILFSVIVSTISTFKSYISKNRFNSSAMDDERIKKKDKAKLEFKKKAFEFKEYREIVLKKIDIVKAFAPISIFATILAWYSNNMGKEDLKIEILYMNILRRDAVLILGTTLILLFIFYLVYLYNDYKELNLQYIKYEQIVMEYEELEKRKNINK